MLNLTCSNDTKAAQVKVSTVREDWGDDDRRLMMLNLYKGNESIGLFDTFEQVKAFCKKNNYELSN